MAASRATIVSAGTVVTGLDVLRPGWVRVVGSRITHVGEGISPRDADVEALAGVITAGFVDIHVHGGGGASFTSGDADEAARAVAFHRRHGTTSMLASLVSAEPSVLLDGVTMLADLAQDGLLDGIHLEGPWLAPGKRGAHDAATLRHPDPAEIDRLVVAGRGHLAMVTLAPELPGALEAVRRLSQSGVRVAIGHTEADYERTTAAIGAGATVATHLFNAMPLLHHRDPGPVAALLEDSRVTVELIADGTHLHQAVLEHVVARVGPTRVAFVTDAMAAAGMPDGDFTLGQLPVQMRSGIARLADGTLAGSTATTQALYGAALEVCRSYGDPALAAATMTARTPARALGLLDIGTLGPGARADLLVLDANKQVLRVMSAGEWVQS